MKKIFIALLSIISICCYSETRLQDVDYQHLQNVSFPITGYRTVYQEFSKIDTVTALEKPIFDISDADYRLLSNGLYERRFTWYESRSVYSILFNNPIDLGLYNRDKAITASCCGATFYAIGILMNVLAATVAKEPRAAFITQCCSSIPYAIGTGSFIAGWVFQVRANRCFLVSSTNYEISASYRF